MKRYGKGLPIALVAITSAFWFGWFLQSLKAKNQEMVQDRLVLSSSAAVVVPPSGVQYHLEKQKLLHPELRLSESDLEILYRVPLSQLRKIYYERDEKFTDDVVGSKFPVPTSDQEKKVQLEYAFQVLSPLLEKGEGFWSARFDLDLDGKSMETVAIFSLKDSERVAGMSKESTRDLCWYLEIHFHSDEKGDSAGASACLDQLSRVDERFYVKAPIFSKAVEPFYSYIGMSIPEPSRGSGAIQLLSQKNQKWMTHTSEPTWNSITYDEVERLRREWMN